MGVGVGSFPVQPVRVVAHTGQDVFTFPTSHFFRTVADFRLFRGFPGFGQCHKVGFVHLIKEMYGVLALVVPVNEDIEVIAVFGRHCDKLLVRRNRHKGRVPSGVRGSSFRVPHRQRRCRRSRPVPPGSVQRR